MEKILACLNRDYNDYLEMLQQLVNVDCGSRNVEGTKQEVQILIERFKALGNHYQINVIPQANGGQHMVVTRPGRIYGKILLIGHLDTVFPQGTVAKRPFSMDDSKAFGPGVEDMKSGVTSIYYALKTIDELYGDNTKTIQCIFNTDEELGSPNSRATIEAMAKEADCALVLESGRLGGVLYTGRKGVGKYKLMVTGKASHAGGNPQAGANAIVELSHKILEMSQHTDYQRGITVNIGVIKGGHAANAVPDYCEALIDVRITQLEQGPLINSAIHNIANKHFVAGTQTRLEGGINRPPMERTEENLNLFAIAKEIGTFLGMNMTEMVTGGGSDGNFTSALGIPTLDGLGPAGGGSHSKDEFIRLDEIIPKTALLTGLLFKVSEN